MATPEATGAASGVNPLPFDISECEKIAEGSFGTIVYKGIFDDRDVAIKKIVCSQFTVTEKELMIKSDSHPNVIRYYLSRKDNDHYYLVLELCNCTLTEFMDNKLLMNIGEIRILKDVINGLDYLHYNDIIHRDIKPSNILLTDHPSPKAVISDFGISRILPDKKQHKTTSQRRGTEGWIAPEMYKKVKKLTLAIDIFSLGCLIYYVLTNGGHPFDEDEFNVTHSQYDLRLLNDTVVEHVTAYHLIEQMIHYDPNESYIRPNISDVCNHCLLWDVKQQMEFFQYVSDRIISSDDTIRKDLESNASKVFTRNWKDMINEDLRQDLEQGKNRKYDGTSLNDLLRAIRNKCHHYNDLPEPVKGHFKSCDELVTHFTSCFPSLLIVTYDFMKKHNMLTQIHKFNREFDGKKRQIAQLVQENKQLQEAKERERITNERLQQALANVSELQRRVHEKDIQLMDAEQKMKEQLKQKNKTIEEQDSQIAKLMQQLEDKDNQEQRERTTNNERLQQALANVSELQRQVHEKDIQLKDAEQKMKEQLQPKDKTIEEQDSQIAKLMQQLEDKNNTSSNTRYGMAWQPLFRPQLTNDDVEKLRRIIKEVLRSHHANLSQLPSECLRDLSNNLYASMLIGEAVRNDPSMDKCIGEFSAALQWLKDQAAIQNHCSKLFKAFRAVGGSYAMAANVICEELTTAINNQLNCDFII